MRSLSIVIDRSLLLQPVRGIVTLVLFSWCVTMRGQTDDYPIPTPPDSITDRAAKITYLAEHYWDRFDFCDTTLLHRGVYAEQAVSNFLFILNYAEEKADAVSKWITRVSVNAVSRRYFMEMAEKYLYETGSPMHNERLFALVLKQVLATDGWADDLSQRASILLRLVEKNQPGSVAEDFSFLLPDGSTSTLHGLHSDNWVLLLFYDPDCNNCQKIISQLTANETLQQTIASRRLSVLAVYAEGDQERWKATYNSLPANWLKAMDCSNVRGHLLYDLKAMPTMLLMDCSCRVLLKDCDIDELEDYLKRL